LRFFFRCFNIFCFDETQWFRYRYRQAKGLALSPDQSIRVLESVKVRLEASHQTGGSGYQTLTWNELKQFCDPELCTEPQLAALMKKYGDSSVRLCPFLLHHLKFHFFFICDSFKTFSRSIEDSDAIRMVLEICDLGIWSSRASAIEAKTTSLD
jgi:hypothetical protein